MNTRHAAAPRNTAAALRIGGFQPFTTLDFPGRMAAVVFLQGCPLQCVYCHNRDLIPARAENNIGWADIRQRLAARTGLLDAVVFSGGEPLLQAALADALCQVRDMGFRTGLHTSGVLPDRFARLAGLLDWVGFDIKAPFDRYGAMTGLDASGARADASLATLAGWSIPFEVRVTIWPALIGVDEIRAISDSAEAAGCRDFVLQECRDPNSGAGLGGAVFDDADLRDELAARFSGFRVRRVH